MDLVKDFILILLPVGIGAILIFSWDFIPLFLSKDTRGVAMGGLKTSEKRLLIVSIITLVLFVGLVYFDTIYTKQRDAELNETIKTTIQTTINEAIDRQTQAIVNAIQQGVANGNTTTPTTK